MEAEPRRRVLMAPKGNPSGLYSVWGLIMETYRNILIVMLNRRASDVLVRLCLLDLGSNRQV